MIDIVMDLIPFTQEEKKEFKNIVNPIYNHPEFQKRLTSDFYHHNTTTLGEHILIDAIFTYKKSLNIVSPNYNIKSAVLIAMFHDLYTEPWQNTNIKKKYFVNKHGFIHPVDAIINAITWFPEYFQDEETEKIIDGVIHHMIAFPVRAFNKKSMELVSVDKFKKLDIYYQELIIKSANRNKIGSISMTKSLYLEGRIVSKMDYKTSLKQLRNIKALCSLVTGKNKNTKKITVQ